MIGRLRIRLVVDPARARIWHRRLVEVLRKKGHEVAVAVRRAGTKPPAAITLLLALERLVYRQSDHAASAEWKADDLAREAAHGETGDADLILDMSGSDAPDAAVRTLRPIYARSRVEEAAVSELLDGRLPEIGILDSMSIPSLPHMFRAAVERPRVLCKALDNLCARFVTLFAVAVDDIACGRVHSGSPAANAPVDLRPAALAALIARARMALTSLSTAAPHWFVGWRPAGVDRLSETMQLPRAGWRRLPDDGARFYADPFLFERNGHLWLFLEEFQYAAGKALISVVELGPNGPIGTPRPIIERPYHLSYPFVFERDGEIWMLPEMSSARRVELLRATSFPDKWEPAGVLLDDQEIADATIVEHNNRLWMFGTVGAGETSSWDALHLWHAADLKSVWTPHERNPVLVDAGSARPAGAFYRRAGQLWRPAQDCTRGYGSGLALARVTALDETRYAQEVATVLYPGAAWTGSGLHTLNWVRGIEVVDGCIGRGKTP